MSAFAHFRQVRPLPPHQSGGEAVLVVRPVAGEAVTFFNEKAPLVGNGVGRVANDGTDIADVNPNGSTVNLAEDFYRPDLINPSGATVNLVDRNGNPDPHTSSSGSPDTPTSTSP